jgi:hypothetical protein
MKRIFLITIPFIISLTVFGQRNYSKIDSLSSNEEVEKLVRRFYNDEYEQFTLNENLNDYKSGYEKNEDDDFCRRTADSLNITQSFYKVDFDKNGFTDLLVIGKYYNFNISVLMNYGQDSLKLHRLTRRTFQECTYPLIMHDSLIKYYYIPPYDWRTKRKQALKYKDLIFKYGDFIEVNPMPKIYDIDKIVYETTMCFGTCPAFTIEIGKDRKGIYKAEYHNRETKNSKEIKGTFKAIIDEKSYSEIIDLVNYLDFPNLNDNYSVEWTDDQSCYLTISYGNGQQKKIKDYGLIGTYGLDRLYQLLFELRFNQKWK